VSQKKQDTLLMSKTSRKIDRFSYLTDVAALKL